MKYWRRKWCEKEERTKPLKYGSNAHERDIEQHL